MSTTLVIYIPLTKITAAQKEVKHSYYRLCELYFLVGISAVYIPSRKRCIHANVIACYHQIR